MFKLLRLLLFLLMIVNGGSAFAAHGFAMYDVPKYPAGFQHFDYVNPDAPKRGELFLANPDRRTSFDKFNPFSLKGVAPPGVDNLMFETLAVGSADETASMYGLLAEDMELAPDRMSIIFRLNPKAHFNNGDPVLASDVKYSFDTLLSKGSPQFKSIFADVKQCVVLGKRTVRFDFKALHRELPLIVGAVPVFSRKWAPGTSFDNIQLQPPIASGPYLIEKYDVSRSITYKRDPNYWGTDVPSVKGMYNFNRITYRFYKDDVARLEAFKAGEFDMVVENTAKNWARNYNGPQFRNGEIVKRELKHSNVAGMQGFVMNLRHPKFQDIRVRKALDLALDFEWMNRQLFFGQYRRIYSYFNNSELAATGMPSEDELKLLEPLRAKLDPAVFGPAPVQPSTDPPGSLRANLVKARELLKQAGWKYRDGALRNAAGEPFVIEYLEDEPSMSRIISVYARALEKLGIKIRERMVDYALYEKRMEEFDFDMVSIRFSVSPSPGTELFDIFGSKAAGVQGSSNYWGIKDPVVDQLIKALVAATTRKEQIAAAHALDRVLMHKYITVPAWYSDVHRVAYHNRFGMPAIMPLYYEADPYVISTWWEEKPR